MTPGNSMGVEIDWNRIIPVIIRSICEDRAVVARMENMSVIIFMWKMVLQHICFRRTIAWRPELGSAHFLNETQITQRRTT
jgi:hypothetical protein